MGFVNIKDIKDYKNKDVTQRVELFGNKGMVISENQRDLETAFYFKNKTSNH